MTNNCILIHYHEISLKGDNRQWFENVFLQNVKENIKDLPCDRVALSGARVYVFGVDPERWAEYANRLGDVMGLSNATLCIQISADLYQLKIAAESQIPEQPFETFRITARRQYKNFPMTTAEINQEIGAHIQQIVQKPVKLKGADLEIFIEVVKGMAYVGSRRVTGFGGLPVGVSESAVSLISSGIDSPVSSFHMMKRGVRLSFVHFHSAPATNRQSIHNVILLLRVLSRYQSICPVYLVPLFEIQQKIMTESPDKFWVLLFRRAMVNLANSIADRIGAPALITGESVGQVASQTLSNIRAVSDAATLPILRPLAGMNKEEIVRTARDIGTYHISIEPYQDCCSFFVPAHPETRADLEKVRRIEKSVDLNRLLEAAIENSEFMKIDRMGIISH